jgi:hypothetical protein
MATWVRCTTSHGDEIRVNLDHVRDRATIPKGSWRNGLRDHLCWRRAKRNRREGRSRTPDRQAGAVTLTYGRPSRPHRSVAKPLTTHDRSQRS